MLSRLRTSMKDKDQGFTLIELLVVMIIIGILAAIAIPIFLNQRKKAVDSAIKSDLRSVANEEESYFVDNQVYVAVGSTTGTATIGTGGTAVKLSTGNTVTVSVNSGATAFCVLGAAATGKATENWVYVSSAGGLQPIGTKVCPGTY